MLDTLGLVKNKKRAKTLIIDSLDNENLILSSRNIQKTKVTNSFGLNIYDIIYHEKLLNSKAALAELSALLDPKRETGKVAAAVVEVEVEEKPKAKKEAKPKAVKAPKAEAAPVVEEAPAVETAEEATENE